MKKIITIAFILFLSAKTNIALSDVRLPSILGDHMVLQQNQDALLWGWSDATEKIVISTSWDTVTYKTTGTRDANWSIKIKTPKANNFGNINAFTVNFLLVNKYHKPNNKRKTRFTEINSTNA
jgi:sialate O-acetylesterase